MRTETKAERDAHYAFNTAVWNKGPCIRFPTCKCNQGTNCDAHHVIRKQTLRAHTSTLDEAERLAIVWDPRNGVPVCPWLHARLTVVGIANVRLTREELEARAPEVLAFAAEHEIDHLLERELARAGNDDATN